MFYRAADPATLRIVPLEALTRDALDPLFHRRLTARDAWGRSTRKATQLGFYIRSHWLRMPPAMLARHLWTKGRKGHRPA